MKNRPRVFSAREADRLRNLDGVPLAAFRSRAIAFAIDLFLILVVHIAINFPYELLDSIETGKDLTVSISPLEGLSGLVTLVLYFGLLTYFGRGQTPGKRLMQIRVVSTAHDHLSLWHSIERALGYGASALEGGFGFAQYYIHPNRRTVHDRIAETIVVTEKRPRRAA